MVTEGQDADFNENAKYDEFPHSAESFGPKQGFNTWVQLNKREWFRPEVLAENPALEAFVSTTIAFNYAQFKSSYRESEYFIHKPELAMTGQVSGIDGTVAGFPESDPRIPTLVINHERTLAKKITRSITVGDGQSAGQIIHKEPQE